MSAVPASLFLTEFRRETAHAPLSPRERAVEAAQEREADKAALDARLEEAFARGCESGKASLRAAHAAELEQARSAFDARMAAEREAWIAADGARLAERLDSGLRGLEERIAQTVARILKPFLVEALHRKATAELLAALGVLLAEEPGLGVHVCGPERLLQAVRRGLAGRPLAVTLEPSDSCDVRIRAGHTIIETRLGEWMASLEEAAR